MRPTFAIAAALAALSAPPAFAADQPRRLSGGEVVHRTERVPPGVYHPGPAERRVAVDRVAGRAGVFVTADGEVLPKSFVDPAPPNRIERRIYVREGYRRAFQLYGGFYGLDRWGYGRGGW